MKTIDELVYYCEEPDPVGALLLTGEWGCGKTYLIDNILKNKLNAKAHVLRITLFGVDTIESIHTAVKQAWINEYTKKIGNVANIAHKGKDVVGKLEFLPDWVRGVATTEWQSFISIKNKIDNIPVVLVFDDLERCCLDTIDVLGAINDYCENQKFHTIIVANQEKMKNSKDINDLSYCDVKEKIIHRTIQYIPEYKEIINSVIEKTTYIDENYKEFVKGCADGIFELFTSDIDFEFENGNKRPHNIRSLKCAIRDFYRIYELLTENEFEEIEEWFYNFISYVIAHKANMAKEGKYGTINSDIEVKKLYPAFQNKYMLEAIKKWILHGVWDEDALIYELGVAKFRKRAKTPDEIVRTYDIVDIDDEVLSEGFLKGVEMAYIGDLSLDEYILFIQNNCRGRFYKFELPIEVEWDRVQGGINKAISKLLSSRKDGQQIHTVIGADNKEYFSEEEWKTYQIIEDFRKNDTLSYSNNRKMYIEGMKNDALNIFSKCQNKRFNVFDDEMAEVTAEAYSNGKNSEKHEFSSLFKNMWNESVKDQEFIIKDSVAGFRKLSELLTVQKDSLEYNKKGIAAFHTNNFIQYIHDLIKKLEK